MFSYKFRLQYQNFFATVVAYNLMVTIHIISVRAASPITKEPPTTSVPNLSSRNTFGEFCDSTVNGQCSRHEGLHCNVTNNNKQIGVCTCNETVSEYFFDMEKPEESQCVGLTDFPCINDKCVTNAKCNDVDHNRVCECESNTYMDDQRRCKIKKGFSETCNKNEECGILKDMQLICSDGRCDCNTTISRHGTASKHFLYDDSSNFDYAIENKRSTQCLGLVGLPCQNELCVQNAFCRSTTYSTGTCICLPDYTESKTRSCPSQYGGMCSHKADCIDGLFCWEGICSCRLEDQNYNPSTKTCHSRVNGPCNDDSFGGGSCIENAECTMFTRPKVGVNQTNFGICECRSGFVESADGVCEVQFGEPCLMFGAKCDVAANLKCIDNTCQCKTFSQYNEERRACLISVGGKCKLADSMQSSCVEHATCVGKPNNTVGYGFYGNCECDAGYEVTRSYTCAPSSGESYGTAWKDNQQNLPVCVIGAGISGINLGILLQEKGYEVHVFEKLSKVGGKIDTFTIQNEVLVEMCSILFDTSNNLIQKYINQFGLTAIPFNITDRAVFDSVSGTVLPYPSLNAQQQEELQLAVKQYIAYRTQYEGALDFGYLHATPDLFDPVYTWLNNKNLTALTPILNLIFTIEGYGSLMDTAVLYMLKFVTVKFLLTSLNISGSLYTLQEGLYVLVSKMASLLKNLHLNHELIGLIRKKDHQIIFIKNDRSIQRQICGKTILAFPPLLANLEKVIYDLNYRERSVLKQIKITKYATTALHLPPLTHNVYTEAFELSAKNIPIERAPIGNGEVIALAKQSSRKMQNVFTGYSWIRGDHSTVATKDELHEMSVKMDETLNKMSTRPKTLHPIKTSEFFPHAVPESLRNGFYQNFNSIQGHNGLYYASTIFTFDMMNEALKMTESFVDKYFNDSVQA